MALLCISKGPSAGMAPNSSSTAAGQCSWHQRQLLVCGVVLWVVFKIHSLIQLCRKLSYCTLTSVRTLVTTPRTCTGPGEPYGYFNWNLLGNELSYTVDLSDVGCSCNAVRRKHGYTCLNLHLLMHPLGGVMNTFLTL